MNTYSGDVLEVRFSLGILLGAVLMGAPGKVIWVQVSFGRTLTLDGSPIKGADLIAKMITSRMSAVIISDPDHYGAGDRADFTTIVPTT